MSTILAHLVQARDRVLLDRGHDFEIVLIGLRTDIFPQETILLQIISSRDIRTGCRCQRAMRSSSCSWHHDCTGQFDAEHRWAICQA